MSDSIHNERDVIITLTSETGGKAVYHHRNVHRWHLENALSWYGAGRAAVNLAHRFFVGEAAAATVGKWTFTITSLTEFE